MIFASIFGELTSLPFANSLVGGPEFDQFNHHNFAELFPHSFKDFLSQESLSVLSLPVTLFLTFLNLSHWSLQPEA